MKEPKDVLPKEKKMKRVQELSSDEEVTVGRWKLSDAMQCVRV